MVLEEVRIRAFPANTRPADGAEGVGDAFLAEDVGGHVVLA